MIEEDSVNRTVSVIAGVAVGLASAACSGPDEHRPLAEDEVVHIDVHGYSEPFVRDGVEYHGEAEAHVGKTEPSNAYGFRENDDGEYLPDTFTVSSGLEEVELRCFFWHDSYRRTISSPPCAAVT
ncbi:hypothetical protein [Sorangium sp. So ce233]|uniref:hypothetical protein n=1 Tax=Sorangium sp. So ce233 TaxID=3133290 RepID=UPI003F6111DE